MTRRAILTVVSGPNTGDSLTIEMGTCRLVGRHLSESETAMMDREGNRLLDAPTAQLIEEHLHDKAPATGLTAAPEFSADSFERKPDIILSDESISRAHAMLFLEASGFGVIDLASTNGSNLNNVPVNSALVRDGDSLQLGTTELTVSITE